MDAANTLRRIANRLRGINNDSPADAVDDIAQQTTRAAKLIEPFWPESGEISLFPSDEPRDPITDQNLWQQAWRTIATVVWYSLDPYHHPGLPPGRPTIDSLQTFDDGRSYAAVLEFAPRHWRERANDYAEICDELADWISEDHAVSVVSDDSGRKPDANRTQKKISTKNQRPWDETCQRMAKAYIRQCVKDGAEIARLPFITEELRKNRTNYPNAKAAATINKAFQSNPKQWKPALSEALSGPDADRTH